VTYEDVLAHLLSLIGRSVYVSVGASGRSIASVTGTLIRAADSDLARPHREQPPDHEAMRFAFEENGLADFVIHRSHFEGAELDGPTLIVLELGVSVTVVLRP